MDGVQVSNFSMDDVQILSKCCIQFVLLAAVSYSIQYLDTLL